MATKGRKVACGIQAVVALAGGIWAFGVSFVEPVSGAGFALGAALVVLGIELAWRAKQP
jgi:hypothetical protein